MTKRALPFALSLVLAIGMSPAYGFAAAAKDMSSGIEVAAVTSQGYLGGQEHGCLWEYDSDTNTLTVHGGNGSAMTDDEKTAYDEAKATAKSIVFQAKVGNEYAKDFANPGSLVADAPEVETIDLTGLDNQSGESTGMFGNCPKLTTVTIGEAFTFKDAEGKAVCPLPDGNWKVASNSNIADTAENIAQNHQAGTADTYTKHVEETGPSVDYRSYTVNYLLQGTTTSLASSKTVENQAVGSTVSANSISIDGYTLVSPSTQNLTIGTTGNVINFYYTPRTDLSCTVNYLEQGTGKVLSIADTKNNQTFGAEVTVNAISISGYTLVGQSTKTITIGTGVNEVDFYYTADEDDNGDNGDDNNGGDGDDNNGGDDNPGDGDDNRPPTSDKPAVGGDDDEDDNSDKDGDVEAPTHHVMHRLYNPNSGEHFFTTSAAEKANLVNLGWKDEGEGWVAAVTGTPVYRLYNPNAGEHHYTTSSDERAFLIAAGWNDEGVGFYSDDDKGTPLYRLYNPNEFANNHHYTRNTAERDALKALGWHDEGIGWYGIS